MFRWFGKKVKAEERDTKKRNVVQRSTSWSVAKSCSTLPSPPAPPLGVKGVKDRSSTMRSQSVRSMDTRVASEERETKLAAVGLIMDFL